MRCARRGFGSRRRCLAQGVPPYGRKVPFVLGVELAHWAKTIVESTLTLLAIILAWYLQMVRRPQPPHALDACSRRMHLHACARRSALPSKLGIP